MQQGKAVKGGGEAGTRKGDAFDEWFRAFDHWKYHRRAGRRVQGIGE